MAKVKRRNWKKRPELPPRFITFYPRLWIFFKPFCPLSFLARPIHNEKKITMQHCEKIKMQLDSKLGSTSNDLWFDWCFQKYNGKNFKKPLKINAVSKKAATISGFQIFFHVHFFRNTSSATFHDVCLHLNLKHTPFLFHLSKAAFVVFFGDFPS